MKKLSNNINKQKILIIKHGAFGDVVQADGVLKDIRKAYPKASITLLTSPAYKKMMQRCPHINDVLVDERAPFWQVHKIIKLKQMLEQQTYDKVIDLQNSTRTGIYRNLLCKTSHWIYRPSNEPKPLSGLQGLKILLEKNNIPTKHSLFPKVTWMADKVIGLLDKQKIKKPYIVLIPGCSAKHPEKRWPHFGKLSECLTQLNYEVVSVIGPDEKSMASTLAGKVLKNLSWFELAGVLQEAKFVIGNDTGPTHVASCLNKQGVALFGPSTSAARSELARGEFKTLETKNLKQLSVETLIKKVRRIYKPHKKD